MGDKPARIKERLYDYCRHHDVYFNDVLQGWKIKTALREAKKYKIRLPYPLPITRGEIDSIKTVKGRFSQEFLFILLVMAKYLKYSNTRIKPLTRPRLLGLLYVKEDSRHIFKQIDIKIKKREREEIIHSLYLQGYLDKTSRGAFLIKYGNEDSETGLIVEDYENIVLYWRRLSGRPIAGCSCGRLFIRGKGINKCPACRKKDRKPRNKTL